MSLHYTELAELLSAIKATGQAFAATVQLHDELEAVGNAVSISPDLWSQAIRAQRQVEAAHLAMFESIRNQVQRH